MKIMPSVVLGCLLAIILPVQSAEPEKVSMAYEPETRDVEPLKLPGSCPVSVVSIRDQRNNKETVGTEYFTVLSGNPVPWVGAALDNLRAYGYPVTKGEAAPQGGIAMTADLIRSYVHHGPMRINGMVALDAEFALPSGEKISRKYRASGNKINMAGSTSEYMTTLNYAMNNLLDRLAADLQELCGRATSAAAGSR